MGIDIKITNKLDNNCVQVEVNSNKGGQSKYFKVPVDKADSFIANYKKNDKNTSFITNTAFVSSIFGGVLLSSLATKKVYKKRNSKVDYKYFSRHCRCNRFCCSFQQLH